MRAVANNGKVVALVPLLMLPFLPPSNPDRLVHPLGVAGFSASGSINQLQPDPAMRSQMGQAAQQIRQDQFLMDRLCERVYALMLEDCRLQGERMDPTRRSY